VIHHHQIGSSQLPLHAHLEVAGTSWLLATNHECMVKTVQRWQGSRSSSHGVALDVFVDDRLSPTLRDPVYRGREHLVFASFGSDFFGFDLRRKRISAVVCRKTASDQKFWDRVLLPIAMGVMGCFVGVVPVHSACLEWNGVGVLIAGVSGAGKSTLTAALAECGFAYISDDWTYFSTDNAGLLAHGLEVPLKLLPNSAQFFSGLSRHRLAPAMNGELAYEVSASEFAAKTRLSTRPRHLFVLERTSRRPTGFQAIPPSQVREFFEKSGERFPDSLNEARSFRSQIIERIAGLRCWRFCVSGSPHDAANSIRRFLGH
jgi:hypothetical protein